MPYLDVAPSFGLEIQFFKCGGNGAVPIWQWNLAFRIYHNMDIPFQKADNQNSIESQ